MLVKEKRRRISPSPHMANYIKQIIFVCAAISLWCGYSIFPLRSCLHQVISSIEQKRKYLYFYNAKNAHKDLRAKSPVFMRFFIIQAWFVLYSFFMFLRRKTLDKAAFLQNLYRFSIQFLQSPSHSSLYEEISKAYGIFFKVCWI